MPSYPKIRFFLFILLLVISLNSCNKEKNDVIPDVYVYFTLELSDPEFVNLNSTFGSALINSKTNNYGSSAAGFDGNGIIIFGGVDQFYSYDRTCPHDYALTGLSVKVNIVDLIYAECPNCHTKYALTAGGTPSSGAGRYPLKNYRVINNGTSITVTNY